MADVRGWIAARSVTGAQAGQADIHGNRVSIRGLRDVRTGCTHLSRWTAGACPSLQTGVPGKASKPNFTTENTENHGGPRSSEEFRRLGRRPNKYRAERILILLREPPWFSVFSVVESCPPHRSRAPTVQRIRHARLALPCGTLEGSSPARHVSGGAMSCRSIGRGSAPSAGGESAPCRNTTIGLPSG